MLSRSLRIASKREVAIKSNIIVKGVDKVMDEYIPLSYWEAIKQNRLSGLKTKMMKGSLNALNTALLVNYANSQRKSLPNEIDWLYKGLYFGISKGNKGIINKVCSPTFAVEMKKRIVPSLESTITFKSITYRRLFLNAMVPKFVGTRMLIQSMEKPEFDYLFQATMKIESTMDIHGICNGKSFNFENEQQTEYYVVETLKQENVVYPWKFCGKLSPVETTSLSDKIEFDQK